MSDWTPPWLGVNDAAPPPASGKPAGARPRGPATADGGLKRRPSSGAQNGWQSPSWGADAQIKEEEHDRDEGGKPDRKPPKAAVDWSSDWRPPGYDRLRKAKRSKRAADDIALDSARSRALITARYLIRATSQAPRMAFDKALVTRALASQTHRIAMDQTSVRTFSPDGHMHVALSNISRAQVSPYYGKEIPDSDKLGLDPEKKYMLLRHPDELAKAAQTFNGIPILIDHKPISADDHPQDLVIGTTGTDARWEAPFLQNSLHFWAKPAIDAIQSNKRRELSCAYHYTPLMTPGIYEGKHFDGIMTNLHGNHVALVEDGRVGPAAVVADAMPFGL